jgi:hypothetical protein
MKPSDGYIQYIVNPKSGASSGKFTCRRFHRYLTDRRYEVRAGTTTSLEHACELATDAAVDPDCALVVVAGGDGTVREVAHGLEGSVKPLLVVPCGTENLLANELGFDGRLGPSSARLRAASRVRSTWAPPTAGASLPSSASGSMGTSSIWSAGTAPDTSINSTMCILFGEPSGTTGSSR